MLKSNPDPRPAKKSPADEETAAPDGDAAPGIFTKRTAKVRAGSKLDQRESLTRRAHRMRMKAFFARANSAS